MVETQEDNEDTQDFGALEEDDADLPAYLTSDYLDQCLLYQAASDSNEELEPKNRSASAMSNYSRPLSRYSRDYDDFEVITAS